MYWIIVMICDNTAPIVVITNRVKPRISIHLLKALPHIPSLLQPHIRHHTQADVQSIRRPFLLSGATLAMSCRMPNSLTNILLQHITIVAWRSTVELNGSQFPKSRNKPEYSIGSGSVSYLSGMFVPTLHTWRHEVTTVHPHPHWI